jgi:hypothetical protein
MRTRARGAGAAAVVAALMLGGATAAWSGTRSVSVETTIVVAEHTVKGATQDFGKPGYTPGDPYEFRSVLTDTSTGDRSGALFADCTVHFAAHDRCTNVYELAGRGSIIAEGMIPVAQLTLGGSWVLAVTGGTGEFENVRGSVIVEVVTRHGDTEHSIHLLP